MLDELITPFGKRTDVGDSHKFTSFEAAVQQQIFVLYKNKDPRAKLDGNAILVSEEESNVIKQEMVVQKSILHLSGTRNCQFVKIKPSSDSERFIYFVNTHLHHPINDDYVRYLQTEQILFWLD